MDDLSHFYQVLGLKADATFEEVKQVYRDLVKVWHPDRFSHDERLRLVAQDKLKEINGAYKMLEAHFFNVGIQPETPGAESPPAAAPPETATASPITSRNKTALWASVIVLALVLAASGAFIFTKKKASQKMIIAAETPVVNHGGPSSTQYALSFNGSESGIAINTTGSLTGTFTVECWALTHRPSGPILSSRLPKNFSFEIIFRMGRRIHIDLGDGSHWLGTNLTAAFNFKTDLWYHIACVVTPDDCTVYMNDKKLKVHSFSPPETPVLYDADHMLCLGANTRNTDFLDGCLADVRVWNTARTEDEIKSNMRMPLTGNEPGLQGYWPFKEGFGTNTADGSGHGFNAHFIGNISWSTNFPPALSPK